MKAGGVQLQVRKHAPAAHTPGNEGPRAALLEAEALTKVEAQLNGPHGVRHRAARGRASKELPSSAGVQPCTLWGGKVRARVSGACRGVHTVEGKGRSVWRGSLAMCGCMCVSWLLEHPGSLWK